MSHHVLTTGPGSPFRPVGPASRENWVGSNPNVWKPSVAAGVTREGQVGLMCCTPSTFGFGFFGSTAVCLLWVNACEDAISPGAAVEDGFVCASGGLVETGEAILFP